MSETVNPGGAATVPPVAAPTVVPVASVREYLQGAKTPHYKWWKLLLSGGLFLLIYVLLVNLVAFLHGFIFGPDGAAVAAKAAVAAANPMSHPAALLYVFALVIVLIPALVLALFIVEKRGIGTLSSVQGHLRWGLLGRALVLAAVLWGGTLLYVIATGQPIADLSTVVPQIVIILLLVPLQSAAEEYVIRGGIMQAIGAWGGPAWLAFIISIAVFVPIHTQYVGVGLISVALMGACTAWLTIRTGGLEAAIALHTVNNYLAFGGGLMFGSNPVSDAGMSWLSLLVPSIRLLLFTAIADFWLRRVIIKREGREVMSGAFGGPVGNFGAKDVSGGVPMAGAPVVASASASAPVAAPLPWVPVTVDVDSSPQSGGGSDGGPAHVDSGPQFVDGGSSAF